MTVKFAVIAVVGVPLIVQLLCVRPAGSGVVGSMVQVYGAVPPVTPIVALYGTPTVPLGRVANDSVSGDKIVRLTVPPVPCCGFPLSVAFATKVEVPGVVGVPLTVHPVSVNPGAGVPPVQV